MLKHYRSFTHLGIRLLAYVCFSYIIISEYIITHSRLKILRNYIIHKKHSKLIHYSHMHVPNYIKKETTDSYIQAHMTTNVHNHLLIKALDLNCSTLLIAYIIFVLVLLFICKNSYIYDNPSNLSTNLINFYSKQGLTAISMYFLILGLINIRDVYESLCLKLAIYVTPLIFMFFSVAILAYISSLYTDHLFINQFRN